MKTSKGTGARALTAAGAAGIGFIILLPPQIPPVPQVPTAAGEARGPSVHEANIKSLEQFALFAIEDLPAPEQKRAPEPEEPQPLAGYALVGTAKTGDVTIAVLEHTSGSTRHLGIGDRIDELEVTEITRNAVTLRTGEQEVEIEMTDERRDSASGSLVSGSTSFDF